MLTILLSIYSWTQPCSGCYETEDGYPVGKYDYDEKAKCSVGMGCHECGYTGKRRNAMWLPYTQGESGMVELKPEPKEGGAE